MADTECQSPVEPLGKQVVALCEDASGKRSLTKNLTTDGTPSWLHVSHDGRCLFATQTDTHRVLSFDRAKLKLVSNVSSGGLAPVKLDSYASLLLVANYGGPEKGASVASVHVDVETCALAASNIHSMPFNRPGPDPKRQLSSHIHTVVVDRAGSTDAYVQAFLADLGGDALYTIRVNRSTGSINLVHLTPVAAGSGPRHIALHPWLRTVYVVHEMANSVSAHTLTENGALEQLQTLPTVVANASIPPCAGMLIDGIGQGVGSTCSKAAEIVTNGQSVFVSNRGVDSRFTNTIAGFRVDETNGRLQAAHSPLTASGTRFPRGMTLTDSGNTLLVAGQGSGNLVSFKVQEAGSLQCIGQLESGLATPTTVVSWPS